MVSTFIGFPEDVSSPRTFSRTSSEQSNKLYNSEMRPLFGSRFYGSVSSRVNGPQHLVDPMAVDMTSISTTTTRRRKKRRRSLSSDSSYKLPTAYRFDRAGSSDGSDDFCETTSSTKATVSGLEIQPCSRRSRPPFFRDVARKSYRYFAPFNCCAHDSSLKNRVVVSLRDLQRLPEGTPLTYVCPQADFIAHNIGYLDDVRPLRRFYHDATTVLDRRSVFRIYGIDLSSGGLFDLIDKMTFRRDARDERAYDKNSSHLRTDEESGGGDRNGGGVLMDRDVLRLLGFNDNEDVKTATKKLLRFLGRLHPSLYEVSMTRTTSTIVNDHEYEEEDEETRVYLLRLEIEAFVILANFFFAEYTGRRSVTIDAEGVEDEDHADDLDARSRYSKLLKCALYYEHVDAHFRKYRDMIRESVVDESTTRCTVELANDDSIVMDERDNASSSGRLVICEDSMTTDSIPRQTTPALSAHCRSVDEIDVVNEHSCDLKEESCHRTVPKENNGSESLTMSPRFRRLFPNVRFSHPEDRAEKDEAFSHTVTPSSSSLSDSNTLSTAMIQRRCPDETSPILNDCCSLFEVLRNVSISYHEVRTLLPSSGKCCESFLKNGCISMQHTFPEAFVVLLFEYNNVDGVVTGTKYRWYFNISKVPTYTYNRRLPVHFSKPLAIHYFILNDKAKCEEYRRLLRVRLNDMLYISLNRNTIYYFQDDLSEILRKRVYDLFESLYAQIY